MRRDKWKFSMKISTKNVARKGTKIQDSLRLLYSHDSRDRDVFCPNIAYRNYARHLPLIEDGQRTAKSILSFQSADSGRMEALVGFDGMRANNLRCKWQPPPSSTGQIAMRTWVWASSLGESAECKNYLGSRTRAFLLSKPRWDLSVCGRCTGSVYTILNG